MFLFYDFINYKYIYKIKIYLYIFVNRGMLSNLLVFFLIVRIKFIIIYFKLSVILVLIYLVGF